MGQALDRIGNTWTILVVGGLSNGPMRVNALLRSIGGVSHRMLTPIIFIGSPSVAERLQPLVELPTGHVD